MSSFAKRRILDENRPFYYTYCSAVCAVHDGYLHTIERLAHRLVLDVQQYLAVDLVIVGKGVGL